MRNGNGLQFYFISFYFYPQQRIAFRERKKGREVGRETWMARVASTACFPYMPTTQLCVLPRNQTCNLLVIGQRSNQLSHTSQSWVSVLNMMVKVGLIE